MKLYTEEQVKQLLFDLGDALFNNCQNGIKEGMPKKYSQTLLKDLTPIELPSEEEVEKYIKTFPYTKHLDDGQYNDGVIDGIELGIYWYNEQLKNKI